MKASFAQQIAATSICLDNHAFLIRGRSGSGKSSLALQLIYRGALLISDDVTQLTESGTDLLAVLPERGIGCLEVRSIGIVSGFKVCANAPVAAVIELVDECPERLPEQNIEFLGEHKVPAYRLWKSHPALVDQAWTIMQLSMQKLKLTTTLIEKE